MKQNFKDDFCESLSLHQIEPLITHDEIEKIEDDEIKKGGKFRKRDVLRSFCGRFTVSLVSSDGKRLNHFDCGFSKISFFLERILTEHILMKNSLDSKLQSYSLYSIRIRSRKQEIFKKKTAA